MPADVIVLVGDCLRAATAAERTLPFSLGAADLRFERCYAPGTWTLPAHASLYAGATPLDHGATRRGDALDRDRAWLPERAREHGYETAIFSENPTFSGRYGFDAGIDFADDFVNAKLRPADFAPETVVDEVSARAAIRVLAGIARSDRPVRALSNALYAPLAYGRDRLAAADLPGTRPRFPHRGGHVLTHLHGHATGRSRDTDGPLLAIANLLEPHNPHSVPPAFGADALDLDVPVAEQRRLRAVDDNTRFLFEHPEAPPAPTSETLPTWEAVFDRREEIYAAQVREFDRLVERWAAAAGRQFEDALVVVTGDHGQCFGVEGAVGHHVSLHPHGIQVPLLVSLPASWPGSERTRTSDRPRRIASPVSLVGLSRALGGVVSGAIADADAFVERVRAGSCERGKPRGNGRSALERTSPADGPVVVAVDGPNWNVADLEAAYGADAVGDLAVRKVGLIDGDRQVVLASPWEDDRITATAYDLAGDGRDRIDGCDFNAWRGGSGIGAGLRASLADDRLETFEAWLAPERTATESAPVSDRLRLLGYR